MQQNYGEKFVTYQILHKFVRYFVKCDMLGFIDKMLFISYYYFMITIN